ncbi:hypothetical protein KAI78_02445 [bacterium]|nr:hypothetical protein [bacterium]
MKNSNRKDLEYYYEISDEKLREYSKLTTTEKLNLIEEYLAFFYSIKRLPRS